MYDVNGTWKKKPLFALDPIRISSAQYDLYSLLEIAPDNSKLFMAVREVLEAVAYDFYAARHVSLRDAKTAIREDVSRIARKQNKDEGKILGSVLIVYATLAAYAGQAEARTALALAVDYAVRYGGDCTAVFDVRAVLRDTAGIAPDPSRGTIREARKFIISQFG